MSRRNCIYIHAESCMGGGAPVGIVNLTVCREELGVVHVPPSTGSYAYDYIISFSIP